MLSQACVSFVFVCSMTVLVKGENCSAFRAYQTDVYMNRYAFRHVNTSSLFDCAYECMTSSVCQSFNFDTVSLTCHLNSNSSEDVDVDRRPGFIFTDIKHWDRTLIGSCSEVLCIAPSRCRTLRHGQIQCVPEFAGCGTPPEVPHADVTYEGHFLHAEAYYTCRADFRSISPWIISVCQATREWSEVKDVCARSTWHNPVVPFELKLPEGLANHVIIMGTPTRKRKFSIDFLLRADSLFHISCRFHYKSFVRKVVMNHRKRRYFGKRLTSNIFPFSVNKRFVMRVTLNRGTFEVSVDGRRYWKFKERIAGAEPDRLQIQEDVQVELVNTTNGKLPTS